MKRIAATTKKLLVCALAALLVVCAAPAAALAEEGSFRTFPDVPKSHWAYGVVGEAAAKGYIAGYSNGNFGPEDSVTRGQVAVILWNVRGKVYVGGKKFPDVVKGKYYYQAIQYASGKGIVSGYDNGNFGPEDDVTREQLAVMMANYARNEGELTVDGSFGDYASYPDAGDVSPWASASVGWCVRNKIMGGSAELNPKGTATRAETTKMILFMRGLIKDREPIPYVLSTTYPDSLALMNEYLTRFGKASGWHVVKDGKRLTEWEHGSLPASVVLPIATQYCGAYRPECVEEKDDWGVGMGGGPNGVCNQRAKVQDLESAVRRYFRDVRIEGASGVPEGFHLSGGYCYWGVTAPYGQVGKNGCYQACVERVVSLGEGRFKISFDVVGPLDVDKLPSEDELCAMGRDELLALGSSAAVHDGWAIVSCTGIQESYYLLGWDVKM